MNFDDVKPGQRLNGVVPGRVVTVVSATSHGNGALQLIYRDADDVLNEVILYRGQHELSLADEAARPFDANGSDFRLAAEARRIQLAAEFDPMIAVNTSAVEPLPHQIRAVYDVLLKQTPLRFLLADDPGAGKTIMAGLYLKELLLREDAHRILIVAPGGLVDQWQDELSQKFSLEFPILTADLIDAEKDGRVFDAHPRLIARMDQLARNDDLRAAVDRASWDVVVVDEAHRMAAHYYGRELRKTKRYQLGEQLSRRTRHFLLMTATPHAGSDENFQLFLALLDPDRFAGRYRPGVHSGDTQGYMRRMIKEDLLTFEGKPLFPERVAETVPYELSDLEAELYEEVTTYVREEMNRADRLDDKRRNTVGFALTVLQRRLASSPEAIYQSLRRRAARLRMHREAVLAGEQISWQGEAVWDTEERTAAENERLEEQLFDTATSAETVAELEAEIDFLDRLVETARRVRLAGTDRKWNELRAILDGHTLSRPGGERRKLIIFTEHKDTLTYLERQVSLLLGEPEAVQTIHGGMSRPARREVTAEFTHNPNCQVLIATDAAGEGLNLQAAHLMVNYDLPWNPNRIEQRFGRIHRIGQTEVCRLWNLVAANTREGQVFTRLFEKIAEQRKAYQGKLFDVLGQSFYETELRKLFIEAIQYGDLEEVRARAAQVIDPGVSDGVEELLGEHALADEAVGGVELEEMRRRMEDARARRLQPHFIEFAFRAAFSRLGGRMSAREPGRFEISHVPATLRYAEAGPIATRYQRVTFDPERMEPPEGAAMRSVADLLAPGHPLHDAVFIEALRRWGDTLTRGTVLISAEVEEPELVLGMRQEVRDGTGATLARRFGYAAITPSGEIADAGIAPHLDTVAAPAVDSRKAVDQLPGLIASEPTGLSWFTQHRLPSFLKEVTSNRLPELKRVKEAILWRLNQEIDQLAVDSQAAAEKQDRGEKVREAPDVLERRREELIARLDKRKVILAQQEHLSTPPLKVESAAIVLPVEWAENPAEIPLPPRDPKEVDARGVAAVLAAERALGRDPVEQPHSNKGFDVLSTAPDGSRIWIEVKSRIAGKRDFHVSHSQVFHGRNTGEQFRLAMVRVDPRGPEYDEIRYLADPFTGIDFGDFDVVGVTVHWERSWAKGSPPF